MTKYRRGVFTKEVIDDLRGIFTKVCLDFEADLAEFDGEHDPVHLLVNSLKGVSGRMIRKKNYAGIRKKLWGGAL